MADARLALPKPELSTCTFGVLDLVGVGQRYQAKAGDTPEVTAIAGQEGLPTDERDAGDQAVDAIERLASLLQIPADRGGAIGRRSVQRPRLP